MEKDSEPKHPRFNFDTFDKEIADVIAENEIIAHQAEDHQLALEGIANEAVQLQHDQNGD